VVRKRIRRYATGDFCIGIDEKIALPSGGISSYGLHRGEGRNQGTLFPVVLGDFVPVDHVFRVIDAFVEFSDWS
jgi:hypothetical protein